MRKGAEIATLVSMSYSTSDLIAIAGAIGDIEKGFGRAKRRNSEIEIRVDSVPIYLRGSLVGHGVRDNASKKLSFEPLNVSRTAPPEPSAPVSESPAPADREIVSGPETGVIVVEESEQSEDKPFGDLFNGLKQDETR